MPSAGRNDPCPCGSGKKFWSGGTCSPRGLPGAIGRAAWVEGEGERKRILGEVECVKGTLTLTTFSRERAARGCTRLEEILGPLTVRHETHDEFDAGELSEDVRNDDTALDLNDVPELKALREQYDREWLDLEIPALDGLTPRQAARDRRLRSRVRDLLISIENEDARMNQQSPRDLTWMWKELRLRRP